ncbi:11749_t:CDS:1, partial [Scutellospora calospora]
AFINLLRTVHEENIILVYNCEDSINEISSSKLQPPLLALLLSLYSISVSTVSISDL